MNKHRFMGTSNEYLSQAYWLRTIAEPGDVDLLWWSYKFRIVASAA